MKAITLPVESCRRIQARDRWFKADAEWSTLLVQTFGYWAGDARYDQRGTSTLELQSAYDAFHAARIAYESINNFTN